MYGSAPRRKVATPPVTLRNIRLLLVDDDADTREALGAVLASYQGEVRLAASASEALEVVCSWRPDVVVSDIAMPGEDGCALMRRVRALDRDAGGATPAIALTGLMNSDESGPLLAAGFQTLLTKPVDADELATVIVAIAGSEDTIATDPDAAALAVRADATVPAMSTLAHDLRQPLFAMGLWLNLLERDIGPAATSEARAHIAQLRAALASLDATIRRHTGSKS